ncbi:MAG: hypothetical protein ACK5IC_11460 [Moheibacter sp.]
MRRYYILYLLILLFTKPLIAQNDVFSELEVTKEIWDKENWETTTTASWKHIYDGVDWDQVGVSIEYKRRLKQWEFQGGLRGYFTFDEHIRNFFEVRPWLGIVLNTDISNRFWLRQNLKLEWRNFIFADDIQQEEDNRIYLRNRYFIGLGMLLSENEEKGTNWKLNTFFEWYFLKSPSSGERFANSREFGLSIQHTLPKGNAVSLRYRIEKFFESSNHEGGNGHTIGLTYSF